MKDISIITQHFSDFSPTQTTQLQALYDLYADWNSKINVVSRKDIEGLYLKHVLHSLAIAAIFEFRPGMQVMDLGAGGGFPCVPLAILFPDTHFLAVDSVGKKLKVVENVAEGAGITNVSTLHSRAENISNQQFDVVVSRAVAPLKDLLQWTKHLLRKPAQVIKQFPPVDEGMRVAAGLISLKGGDLAQEISDSGKKPYIWPISEIFKDVYFEEKYLLQVV